MTSFGARAWGVQCLGVWVFGFGGLGGFGFWGLGVSGFWVSGFSGFLVFGFWGLGRRVLGFRGFGV